MSGIAKTAADHLGAWLSSPRSAGHRLGELVGLVNRLNNGGKKLDGDEQWELVSEIGTILEQYPFYFYPIRGDQNSRKYREFLAFQLVSAKTDRDSMQACEVLNSLRVLLEHGELWRVQFCRNCHRYFRGKRRRFGWCSDSCEEKWRGNNREFLEARADRAFKKYWDDKEHFLGGLALKKVQTRRAKADARRELRKGWGRGQ